MEGRHAIERKLDPKQREPWLFEDAANCLDCPICKIAVGGNVDFFYPILPDELPTDRGKFLAQERFAPRKIEIFDRTEILGQRDNLFKRKIVRLIELPPIEAVLAFHVAKGIDKKDEKRWAWHSRDRQVLPV